GVAVRAQAFEDGLHHLNAASVRRPLVHQDDRAGRQVAFDVGRHAHRVIAHGIEAARAPRHPRQAMALERRGDERVGHADHRAEPARRRAGQPRERALGVADLAGHAARAERPEPRLRVGVAVVADTMPAPGDLRHDFRPRRGALANEEEGGLRAMRVEQVEDWQGVVGWAVIDGQPRLLRGGRQAREHRRVEPRARHQRGGDERRVAEQHQRQAGLPAPRPPGQRDQQLRGQERRQPCMRAARDAMQCSPFAHARMMPRAYHGRSPARSMYAMSLDPAVRARIDSLLGEDRVVLFMKGQPNMPQCGFSAKAAGVLNGLGVEFAHVDVLSDPEIREGIKVYGNWPTIPQLYIGGELVGGSDIIEEMANSGELNEALGLPPIDRTPPSNVTVTPAAAQMLRKALDESGPGNALALSIDGNFRPNFQIARASPNAIAVEAEGLRIQFDPASARRADGITIDWVDDMRGKGLAIDNPNA